MQLRKQKGVQTVSCKQSTPASNAVQIDARVKRERSALARLEARVGLVDDVNAALAPYQTIVTVAFCQRFERVTNFHVNHHNGRQRLRMGAFDPPISGKALL